MTQVAQDKTILVALRQKHCPMPDNLMRKLAIQSTSLLSRKLVRLSMNLMFLNQDKAIHQAMKSTKRTKKSKSITGKKGMMMKKTLLYLETRSNIKRSRDLVLTNKLCLTFRSLNSKRLLRSKLHHHQNLNL